MIKPNINNNLFQSNINFYFSKKMSGQKLFAHLQATRPRKVKGKYFITQTINVETIEIENVIKFTIIRPGEEKGINIIEIDAWSKKHKEFRMFTRCKANNLIDDDRNCDIEEYTNGLVRKYGILNHYQNNGKFNVKIYCFTDNWIKLFYENKRLVGLAYYRKGFINKLFTFKKSICYEHLTIVHDDKGNIAIPAIIFGGTLLSILGALWFFYNLMVAVIVFFFSFGLVNWVSFAHPNLSPVWRGVVVATYAIVFVLLRFII